MKHYSLRLLAAVMLSVFVFLGHAQTPAQPEVFARDMKEEIVRINVTVKDFFGRHETRAIPITIFRPEGDGPYPFVVFNHGRPVQSKRSTQGRYRPEHAARYLVAKGFVVFVPMRVGYWETYGDFDPEYSGSCSNPYDIEAMSIAASDQVLATAECARSQSYVDASRWLVAGTSVGGLTAVATVGRKPSGLIGGINFVGGTGGDPDRNPNNPCAPNRISNYWGKLANPAVVPMLWMYWQNDKFWGEDHPKVWHKAWVASGASVDFKMFPPTGSDGHSGLNIDMNSWLPVVDNFLSKLGFDQPAIVSKPPATAYAELTSADKVPVSDPGKAGYARFLEAKLPRAFAIGERGGWGFSSGDYAMGKAIGNCQRTGQKCKLYAVDNDVVWQ